MQTVQSQGEKQVLMVVPYCPYKTWFSEFTMIVLSPPWLIPLRKDFLTQGQSTILYPCPDLWNLHIWFLDGTGRNSEAVPPTVIDDLIIRFLRSLQRLNPPKPCLIPSWDLSLVLQALQEDLFEHLQSNEFSALSMKMALLILLTSIKRVGDLQAFYVCELQPYRLW